MRKFTEKEILAAIGENPMICTRALVKKLRPDEFADAEDYKVCLCAI